MRFLAFDVHPVLTRSLLRAFEALGHELWLPVGTVAAWGGRKLGHVQPTVDRFPGARGLSPGQLDQVAFDGVLIPGHDVQRDVLQGIWPVQAQLGAKLVFFCGNELPHYRWDLARNVLAADRASFDFARSKGMHALLYFPWVDYPAFPFEGPSDAPVVRTYIGNYARRYPADFRAAERIVGQVPGLRLEHVDGQDQAAVARLMRESLLTVHLKPKEGYGYSVLESLASGRPVLMPRRYVTGKTLAHWVVDGESALLFDREEEAVEKLRRFVADAPFRHRLQSRAAELVRERVDNGRQTEALADFLANLRPQGPKSLLSRGLDVWKRHRPDPTLDRA